MVLLCLAGAGGFGFPVGGQTLVFWGESGGHAVVLGEADGGGGVAVFGFGLQAGDLLRTEGEDAAGGEGGFGVVVHFVQHGLQVRRQGHAALLEFVCPGGGIEIAVLGEEFFGGGADFFVGSRLGNLRLAGLWFVSLRGLRAGGGGGHGGVFLAGGKEKKAGEEGGQAFHGFSFGMCFCLAEGYLKNGSGEVSGSL